MKAIAGGKQASTRLRERFRVLAFTNRSGTTSWRVSGTKRDGTRVRDNFPNEPAAVLRKQALELEFYGENVTQAPAVQATNLTEESLRIAERALARLDTPEELLSAVDYWLHKGRDQHRPESPKLDDAYEEFLRWTLTEGLRPLTVHNLRVRCGMFVNSTSNKTVADIEPDDVKAFLATRDVGATTRNNDRRALSSFFSWCMENKWIAANPCQRKRRRGKRADDNGHTPAVLTVDECEKLLRAAEQHREGRLVPYVATALYAGLRPFELRRLSWESVNLKDREISLLSHHTKTGKPRVVAIHPTLAAWLKSCEGVPFYPANWTRDFDIIKETAGFRGRVSKKNDEFKPWPVDCMRHTAISHYFRETGSYGRTAEQFGNSEGIIKAHYQGRVSSADTKRFFSIKPSTKGGKA